MEIKAVIAQAKFYFVNDLIVAIRSKDKVTLHPIVLFGSMVLSMGITFLSSIVTARALGPTNYGDLKFIQTVWSLSSLLITFGYFYSGGRVLVLENDLEKCREISGTIIVISLIMGTIITLVNLLIAYPLDYIFHTNVAIIMYQMAPLILVILLSQSLPIILQSTNQIYYLASFTAAPSFLYMISILVLSEINQISTGLVLLSQQLSLLIVVILILVCIKPSFYSIRFWWVEVKKHNKTYGNPVYFGSLANVGSGYLNRLAISYWVDNTAIGFFSLASSLVEPLKVLPNAIATSSFRSFAQNPKISKKILSATIISSIISLILAILFFGQTLSWIYTVEFQQVGPMAQALSFGAILVGFGDLFNRFMGAHGKGKSLQNAAYAMGIANVAGFFILVPLLGTWGAVLATILGGAIYFSKLFFSYTNFSKELSRNNDLPKFS